MDADQLARIKTVVTAKIGETRQAIAAHEGDSGGIAPDNAIGRISRMGAMYDREVNKATLERARERLAKLEVVLHQIDTPGFGHCEFCGDPIQPARIMAMPESSTCIRCAAFGD